ncbi:MAG: pyridoxal-phosphate dependent enzyme, partial [Sediminibacterium sp.]|nr:pyridoxal-phosphate dependent enzyme [Sediminibacterium sp.]
MIGNHTIKQSFGLDIEAASIKLRQVVKHTPLIFNASLSKKYDCTIYLKREDLQIVRSYKLRGAYNMISSLSETQRLNGVVCASAGNHAQGFAYSCKLLNIKGVVFMPIITPNQKVTQTKMFGDGHIEIKLVGDTFDDCATAAKA